MPFDWLHPNVPAAVRARDPENRRQQCESDIRTRAGLLQRLGRDQATALHRCLGNMSWGYELSGQPPLSEDEVRAVIQDVYVRRPGG